MVISILRGGLGNQMFQYAAGLNLALKNKTELVLDTTYLNDRFPRKEVTFRNYDMDIFSIAPRFTALSKASGRFPIPGLWLGLDLGLTRARDVLGIRRLVKEREDFIFDPSVLAAGPSTALWGHWQTEKYFEESKERIRREFHFKDELRGEAEEIRKKISASASVALHVRRGDYVAFKRVANDMGTADIEYYEKAVRYVAERVKNPSFFVVSDDIEWCRENIKPPFPTMYLTDASRGPKASYHLHLMSLCEHNIIANSTFSWWGAWLNMNPKKIVVAPARWSASAEKKKLDIIPAGWTLI